jgi:hypothetical protein
MGFTIQSSASVFRAINIRPRANVISLQAEAQKFSVSPFTKGDDFGRLF